MLRPIRESFFVDVLPGFPGRLEFLARLLVVFPINQILSILVRAALFKDSADFVEVFVVKVSVRVWR